MSSGDSSFSDSDSSFSDPDSVDLSSSCSLELISSKIYLEQYTFENINKVINPNRINRLAVMFYDIVLKIILLFLSYPISQKVTF